MSRLKKKRLNIILIIDETRIKMKIKKKNTIKEIDKWEKRNRKKKKEKNWKKLL